MALSELQKRINSELRQSGVTSYGQHKLVTRSLPNIIRDDENIHGVVYGWSKNGFAMLVATNNRIIYLLRGLLTSSVDELGYDVVSGIRTKSQGVITVLVLHTRIGDYRLTNINNNCARIFIAYVETRFEHLEENEENIDQSPPLQIQQTPKAPVSVTPEAREFLIEHDLAVLSTKNQAGDIWGAVVYYLVNDQNEFFILTKSETRKAHNMLSDQHVSLTIYDQKTVQTLQLQGITEIETSKPKKEYVYEKITQARMFGQAPINSPVTKIHDGSYVVFQKIPTNLAFHDYKI